MSTDYKLTEDSDVKLKLVEQSNKFDLCVESKVDFLPNVTVLKSMTFQTVRKLRDDIDEVLSFFDEQDDFIDLENFTKHKMRCEHRITQKDANEDEVWVFCTLKSNKSNEEGNCNTLYCPRLRIYK